MDYSIRDERTLDDLDLEAWIPIPIKDYSVVDLSTTRLYVDTYPLTGERLRAGFTIFFEDQSNYQDENQTLYQMLGKHGWKGNILVMRNTTKDRVTHISEDDFPLVSEILRQ